MEASADEAAQHDQYVAEMEKEDESSSYASSEELDSPEKTSEGADEADSGLEAQEASVHTTKAKHAQA